MSENINTTEKKSVSVTEVEKENAELKSQVAELQAQMSAVLKALEASKNVTQPTINVVAPSTDVHIKYMSDSMGYIEAGHVKLDCTRYGEEFTVSRGDADAIVGKYRRWFDSGILAIAPADVEYAAGKGVRTSDEYALTAEKLNKLGTMSCDQIEKLWSTLGDEHKLSLVTFFKRKFIEGREEGYQDRAKIDLLNRLTKNGLKREATEVSGGDLKIAPVDMGKIDVSEFIK